MNSKKQKQPSHPHKSTTQQEEFYHKVWDNNSCCDIPGDDGEVKRSIQAVTAFARKMGEDWYVSYAECDWRDQFCKATGRVVARRKWFAGKNDLIHISNQERQPSYEAVFLPYANEE